MSEVANRLTLQTEIQNFLNAFCIPDRKEITETVHKQMMKAHFYYVDCFNQGWYVLDDCSQFHRQPTGDEWNIYGTLWTDLTADE